MAQRPARGSITSRCGYRIHPISKLRQLHAGEDIGWSGGTNLVAPIDCVLADYQWAGGYGNLVVLRSGNTEIRLAHTARLADGVKKGQTFDEGELVAIMGTTGNSDGVHVHWEVYVNGVRQDPAERLARQG